MNAVLRYTLAIASLAVVSQAAAQVILYRYEDFQGQSFTTERQVVNLERHGFNDRASSVKVLGESWEVCDDAQFRGRCILLRPGRYASLTAMGLNDRVSSVRAVSRGMHVDQRRYAPGPMAAGDYRRRHGEQLYEANVTSVHAVLGTSNQRCWVEREQVPQERNDANVQGAIVGAIIGGVLGHQIVRGGSQGIATVGGAVAGAAVGANIGRGDARQARTQEIQHCRNVPNEARPDYWDVTYDFRGQEHRSQMTAPPGSTVMVNDHGEPRM
ncbi:MAG: beta/gamma crystallin-related protein [Arenicellales bacterium]